MVGPAIRVEDQVGFDIGPGRLDEDMDAGRAARAADGIADDPAGRVAGGDRTVADQPLAVVECDLGDPSGARIDPVERARAVVIDLNRIEVSLPQGFDPRGGIGRGDPCGRRSRACRPAACGRHDRGTMQRLGTSLDGHGGGWRQWRDGGVVV